jgi:phosphatidylglycerol:prolipoprotein diacylglycerol transferase
MLPHLFRLGPLQISTHDAFVALGALAAVWVYLREAERRRLLTRQIGWVAMGAVLSGALAARLATLWRYVELAGEPSLAGAALYGGKSVLGGLAGAYVGAVLTKRLVGYRESTGDLFAPAVAVGMAVGRWGCFFTEQVGTPTSLPWGLAVDAEAAARIPMCGACAPGVPMHPSFLYEIAFHAAMVGVLGWLRPRVPVRGELLKIYLLAYAVFRFLVEFVRGNPEAWLGLSYSQLFLIPTTLLLACYFARQIARRAYVVPPLGATA